MVDLLERLKAALADRYRLGSVIGLVRPTTARPARELSQPDRRGL